MFDVDNVPKFLIFIPSHMLTPNITLCVTYFYDLSTGGGRGGMGIDRITIPRHEMLNKFWRLILDSDARSQKILTLTSNFIYSSSGYTRVNLCTDKYNKILINIHS